MRHFALLAVAGLLGCSGNAANNSDGGTTGDLGQSSGQKYTASIGPISLSPAQERTVCSTFRLPNTDAIDVVQISAILAPGSHHLILYKSAATTEQKDFYDCQPLDISGGDIPIYIAETESNNDLPLPPGVAYHLDAGQMVRLEAHYINATTQAITGMGNVDLYLGNPGTYEKADIMFCGSVTPLVKSLGGPGVPPGMSTLPAGFYSPPAGTKIFGLTTHEHKRGSLMTLAKSTGASDPGMILDNGTPYDNPPFVIYDAQHLLTFNAGEGIRWDCSYNNTTSNTYYFGQSAENNEMCFFWGYYYPSAGHFISDECAR